TIVNGMVAGGMLVDGIWEFSPGPPEPHPEPGSDAHLDTLFPAFIEVRGRKLAAGALPLHTPSAARSAAAAKGTSRPRGRRRRKLARTEGATMRRRSRPASCRSRRPPSRSL